VTVTTVPMVASRPVTRRRARARAAMTRSRAAAPDALIARVMTEQEGRGAATLTALRRRILMFLARG